MKVVVLQENLVAALGKVIHVVDTKANLAVLTNCLLEATDNQLKITGTNLETSLHIQIGIQLEQAGKLTVPAHTFHNYVNLLAPGKLTLKQKENNLWVQTENQRAAFPTLDPGDFPALPARARHPLLAIAAPKLKSAIRHTIFAVAADTTRPILTGVLLKLQKGGLTLVGTDGFRLAEFKLELPDLTPREELSLVISAGGLSELERLLGDDEGEKAQIFRSEDGNHLVFHLPQVVSYARLLEADYPDYEKILPQQLVTKAYLEREALLPAIKQVALFSSQIAPTVELNFSVEHQNLKLSAQAAQLGQAESVLPVKIEGENQKLGFNARFLIEALSHFGSEQLVVEMKEAVAPVLISSPDEPLYRQVVMPVRLTPETKQE